jgi:hypothetical protein
MESHEIRQDTARSIRKLKAFAQDRLPNGSPLRDLLLTEPDELPSSELLVKTSVWLRLLKIGGSDS